MLISPMDEVGDKLIAELSVGAEKVGIGESGVLAIIKTVH